MLAMTSTEAAEMRAILRILVADDNEVIRLAVGGLLRRLGHSVAEASDGREAVELASRRRFDLVILDLQMPVMGGLEAARALISVLPGGPAPRIVGLSGEREARESIAEAGMDDFLLKPVRLADLARILKR